ncbi:allophanate hydrolase [Polaribacter sp. SA4-10]|uniref:5-oxoprolinase subunit PxpB n=1 Tax=Polaribacter sp. SA4-10 TaxID=754397 RepID=UPI000B3C33FE|nr:5-oxoprolinase subunit PxpB [Polaribacter sp. SA4-10]ARV07458.1 allophanate hydrolase [Polaribacter sp. SA4-10]
MVKEITYKPFGAKAILIEWDSIINDEILADILSFKHKIETLREGFYTDLIVGYNSLTIKYSNQFDAYLNEVEALRVIYKSNLKAQKKINYIWEIPVCYELEFGIDLEAVSQKLNVSIDEVIKLHTNNFYTVFFIGFLPGFLYLGGLNEHLYFERKPNPRLNVAKGSVAIGGKQTGVYPFESPGGWNIIGKTPINLFNIKKDNPCFAKAGDKIQFKSISLNLFCQIEKEIAQDQYQISKTVLDD